MSDVGKIPQRQGIRMNGTTLFKGFVTLSNDCEELHTLIENSGLSYIGIGNTYTFAADREYKNGSNFMTPIGFSVSVSTVDGSADLSTIPVWLRPFAMATPSDYPMVSMTGKPSDIICSIQEFLIRHFSADEIREISEYINREIFHDAIDSDMLSLMLESDILNGKIEPPKPAPRLYKEDDYIGLNGTQRKVKMTEEFLRFGSVKLINDRVHVLSEIKPHTYTASQLELNQRMHDWNRGITHGEFSEIQWKAAGMMRNTPEPPSNLLMCQNGIYDYNTDTILSFNDELAFTNPPINAEYDENAYSEIVDKTLNKISCNDRDIRYLLEEIIGACLCRDNRLIGKLFILYGDGSNGKSVYINMLQKLLGYDNYSTVKMQEFEKDKFTKIDLYGKLANFGDDISAEYMSETSTWKNVVTGDAPIRGEEKGIQSFMFHPYATPIFSCNEIPKVGDLTNGWFRRVVYVPFNAVFSPQDKDFDPLINEKLCTQESLNYLFKLGISGLKRMITNHTTTTGEQVTTLKASIRIESDSLLGFVTEYGINNIPDNVTQDIYDEYLLYCSNNGHKYPITKSKMSRRFNKEYGITVKVCSGNLQIYKRP